MTVTLNPTGAPSQLTFSGGNLTLTSNTSENVMGALATVSFTTGKLYFEATFTQSTGKTVIGFANSSATLLNEYIGFNDTNGFEWQSDNGSVAANGGTAANIMTTTSGHTVACAFDAGGKLVWFKDITAASNWNNTSGASPGGTGGISVSSTTYSTGLFPIVGPSNDTDNLTVNFGGSAFAGSVPSGFSAVQSSGGGCIPGSLSLLGVGCGISPIAQAGIGAGAWAYRNRSKVMTRRPIFLPRRGIHSND